MFSINGKFYIIIHLLLMGVVYGADLPMTNVTHSKTKNEHIFDSSAVAKDQVINRLFDLGSIQFDSFHLKAGFVSPVYVDMRRIISCPDLLPPIATLVWQVIKGCEYDSVCGVPYGALPIAMSVALLHQQPMIMPRKEVKDHGTKRAIEGVYHCGQTVILIEDVITSGTSVLQTVELLYKEGLKVRDVVVFLDREQGGVQCLAKYGIRVHAVCTLSYVIDLLYNGGKINEATCNEVQAFVRENLFI